MSELPLQQLLGTNRGSVLLQPGQHGLWGLGLDSVEHCVTGWLVLAGFVVTEQRTSQLASQL